MSYIPANSDRDLWALFGGLAAAGLGLMWADRMNGRPGKIVAQCADGSVIGRLSGRLRRRPGRSPEQRTRLESHYSDLPADVRRALVSEELQPGDLSFARTRRGRDDEAAWVVDGLDRGREATRITWEFEAEEVARDVLQLLNQRVVRAPGDERGVPLVASERDLDLFARSQVMRQSAAHIRMFFDSLILVVIPIIAQVDLIESVAGAPMCGPGNAADIFYFNAQFDLLSRL